MISPNAACLAGERGGYACRTDVAEMQRAGHRCRRPSPRASTGSAPRPNARLPPPSVIGSRFDADLLASLDIEPVVDELIDAELVDQVRFTTRAEYAFRHPLIRTVAYESQLKVRSRPVAPAAGRRDRGARAAVGRPERRADRRTSGRPPAICYAAYGWHMRAAAWATNRDIAAARAQLGARQNDRRRTCPPMTRTGGSCASLLAPCCAGPPIESTRTMPTRASTNCGSCAPPPGTRRRWPSPWLGW